MGLYYFRVNVAGWLADYMWVYPRNGLRYYGDVPARIVNRFFVSSYVLNPLLRLWVGNEDTEREGCVVFDASLDIERVNLHLLIR